MPVWPRRRCRPLHGGADRNTRLHESPALNDRVAPFTGARIETLTAASSRRRSIASPPSRGRGSKHPARSVLEPMVAPFTGARIETSDRASGSARGRPLHGGADRNIANGGAPAMLGSPPSRGRGSKRRHRLSSRRTSACVAPFTGARIETRTAKRKRSVAPFTGARIETPRPNAGGSRRPLHGGADRNTAPSQVTGMWSPPSRGRGSKHHDLSIRYSN